MLEKFYEAVPLKLSQVKHSKIKIFKRPEFVMVKTNCSNRNKTFFEIINCFSHLFLSSHQTVVL